MEKQVTYDLDKVGYAFRRCRRALAAVFLFSFAINLLMLSAPIYMMQVFDRVLTSRSTETLIYLTLVIGVAFVAMWLLDIMRSRVMVVVGTWFDRQIAAFVLSGSVREALNRRDGSTAALRDLELVRNALIGPIVFPLLDSPWVPVFVVVVFLLHPWLGWIALGGALILLLFAVANDVLTRKAQQRARMADGAAAHQAAGAVKNADAVEAMGMLPAIRRMWQRSHDAALADHARVSKRSGAISASSKMLRQGLQVAMLGFGAYLVLQNQLTAGGMIAGSILMARALAPVEQSISSWRSVMAAFGAYRRNRTFVIETADLRSTMPLPRPSSDVQVRNLTYGYIDREEPLLKNIAFALAPGEALGLIGPTASGKTTLARLIVGNLQPRLGTIRLGAVNVYQWVSADRGQHIGYLAQDVELFAGSVAQNIARMSDAPPEAVIEAAKLAGVHEMILSLPSGYETEIGPSGVALSGGQRQRIGLARAVFGDPCLVVLDEPNSNLDQVGEQALVETIAALKKKGTTVIVVAHRPSVMRAVDKILLLQDGRVKEFGARDEILAKVAGPSAQQAANGSGAPQVVGGTG